MTWPMSQECNEAIQSPLRNFADPDLKRGEVVLNPLGLPMPYSGNFADVYQVRGSDGQRWAVKCFTRESPNLRERYAEISKHLHQARLKFTVDFTWLEEGIRVAGRWYPVLKMQWVEGLTLNQFVSQSLDKPALLEALLHIWARMGRHLRGSGAAHADLQHGNVLLVRDGNALSLKLIDYDGMFVPALADRPSGEVGHPSYQHPKRSVEGAYNIEVDRFPLLLIATALVALKVKGRTLWEKYDNGDNLLFCEPDLAAPDSSPLFAELNNIQDAQVMKLVEAVRQACRQPLERAPFLDELLPKEVPTPKSVPVAAAIAPQVVAIPIGVPPPAASFSDFGGEPSEPSRHRRRAGKPFRRIAAIAGGIAALLLTTVLIIALSGNTEVGKPTGTQQSPLSLGQLPDRRLIAGGDVQQVTVERPSVTDLLALIKPASHAERGTWVKDDKGLLSDDTGNTLLQIPYAPPEEYRLQMIATRLAGDDCMHLGLLYGDVRFMVVIDGWPPDSKSGLDLVDGRVAADNETRLAKPVFTTGTASTIIATVRKSTISVTVDDSVIVNWNVTNPKRLSLRPDMEVRNKRALFFGWYRINIVTTPRHSYAEGWPVARARFQ